MIPRTSALAWAATFLGLSGPFTEPIYFRARSSKVLFLRGRREIARMSDRFMVFALVREFYYRPADPLSSRHDPHALYLRVVRHRRGARCCCATTTDMNLLALAVPSKRSKPS
jgi:hypothetical protein